MITFHAYYLYVFSVSLSTAQQVAIFTTCVTVDQSMDFHFVKHQMIGQKMLNALILSV